MNTKLNRNKISRMDGLSEPMDFPHLDVLNREKLKSTTIQEQTKSNKLINPMSKAAQEVAIKSPFLCIKNLKKSIKTGVIASHDSNDSTYTQDSDLMFRSGTNNTSISKKIKSEILTLKKKNPLNSSKGGNNTLAAGNYIQAELVGQQSGFTQKPISFNFLQVNSARVSNQSLRRIKRAAINSAPTWKSPFKSFVTKGVCTRNSQANLHLNGFAYDLSRDESKFVSSFKSPMKPASEAERELLRNGQRAAYLNHRYEYSPDHKYNYPEATSWRIGWFH